MPADFPSPGFSGVTHLADLIKPEVWSDLVQKEFEETGHLTPYSNVDNTLVGQKGDTIHFPEWLNMADSTVQKGILEDEEIQVHKITQESSQATIQETAHGVSVTERSLLSGLGNALDESVRQQGILMSRALDSDIASVIKYRSGSPALRAGLQADGAPYVVGDGTAAFGLDVVIDAVTVFPDDVGLEDMRALFVNTQEYKALLRDDLYKLQILDSGIKVETFGGVPIVRSDRTSAPGTAYLLAGPVADVLYKQYARTEYEFRPAWRNTAVYTWVHYGVRRSLAGSKNLAVVLTDSTPGA